MPTFSPYKKHSRRNIYMYLVFLESTKIFYSFLEEILTCKYILAYTFLFYKNQEN